MRGLSPPRGQHGSLSDQGTRNPQAGERFQQQRAIGVRLGEEDANLIKGIVLLPNQRKDRACNLTRLPGLIRGGNDLKRGIRERGDRLLRRSPGAFKKPGLDPREYTGRGLGAG